MNDVIKTTSVGKSFAFSDEVILEEKPRSALVFKPAISLKGIRGELIRLKKNSSDRWEMLPKEQLRSMKYLEGTYIELTTEALSKLVEEHKKLMPISEEGVQYGTREYLITDKNTIEINSENKKDIIQKLVDSNLSNDFWEILNENNSKLADKLILGQLQLKKLEVLNELSKRLSGENKYHETKGEDSWQSFIYNNSWIFGVIYKKPIQKQKINLTGIMPDFLFPTIDGFCDILEIKLPTQEVVCEDNSHSGSWVWSADANRAIGQVVNYLCEIDRQRFEVENCIRDKLCSSIKLLKPRAFILIGNSSNWSDSQKDGLRKLNSVLHNIEVLTYQDLLDRGNAFINYEGVL